ncbi:MULTISPECIES: VOC family protein [unclassified Oceanobacter]|uniref:VOC family protein n=1 Tax=unclassified Oceanobacter TaxID=2620260 RepID=UPI002735F567|nr:MULTISPECIES: VOC family protein [unclassified Oceanobacter]MDP2609355.1 VOC family protein [Oceanobacter sp. 1_MG-2023]MDP2612738.1 VOC family protein [Oceanobacter sp. 2_MG-2023]
MSVLGIDEITFGVEDLALCQQFFSDWGLTLLSQSDTEQVFETLNGCRVVIKHKDDPSLPPAFEEGPTLREVVWGVESDDDLDLYAGRMVAKPGFFSTTERVGCLDPNGMGVRLQKSRKRAVTLECVGHNTWAERGRINTPSPVYDKATPIEVGHVVFFVKDVNACEAFYRDTFGFVISDRYPNKGAFMRCSEEGSHHNIFLLQPPEPRAGLNHVAFTVRDLHEVFGGGMNVSRLGWDTELGPGRHPISSAFFWYFRNPAGALVEYYADEDLLTAEWQPREFEPGPTVFAEWAISGGIDGNTRRQANGPQAASKTFITAREKS